MSRPRSIELDIADLRRQLSEASLEEFDIDLLGLFKDVCIGKTGAYRLLVDQHRCAGVIIGPGSGDAAIAYMAKDLDQVWYFTFGGTPVIPGTCIPGLSLNLLSVIAGAFGQDSIDLSWASEYLLYGNIKDKPLAHIIYGVFLPYIRSGSIFEESDYQPTQEAIPALESKRRREFERSKKPPRKRPVNKSDRAYMTLTEICDQAYVSPTNLIAMLQGAGMLSERANRTVLASQLAKFCIITSDLEIKIKAKPAIEQAIVMSRRLAITAKDPYLSDLAAQCAIALSRVLDNL